MSREAKGLKGIEVKKHSGSDSVVLHPNHLWFMEINFKNNR